MKFKYEHICLQPCVYPTQKILNSVTSDSDKGELLTSDSGYDTRKSLSSETTSGTDTDSDKRVRPSLGPRSAETLLRPEIIASYCKVAMTRRTSGRLSCVGFLRGIRGFFFDISKIFDTSGTLHIIGNFIHLKNLGP